MGLAGGQECSLLPSYSAVLQEARPAHPLGTNKQETDTNLALAPSAGPSITAPTALAQGQDKGQQNQESNTLEIASKIKLRTLDSWKGTQNPCLETTGS